MALSVWTGLFKPALIGLDMTSFLGEGWEFRECLHIFFGAPRPFFSFLEITTGRKRVRMRKMEISQSMVCTRCILQSCGYLGKLYMDFVIINENFIADTSVLIHHYYLKAKHYRGRDYQTCDLVLQPHALATGPPLKNRTPRTRGRQLDRTVSNDQSRRWS